MYNTICITALYHPSITSTKRMKRLCEIVQGAGFRARMKKSPFLWRRNLRGSLLRAGGSRTGIMSKLPPSLLTSLHSQFPSPHTQPGGQIYTCRVRVRHVTFKYLTGLTFRRKLVSTGITLVVTRRRCR